jgi:tRNA threonylcarbamoyladenosine biosynthesis protein TsaB
MKSENILAIETSTEYLSIAVTSGEKLVSRGCLAGQKQSELILPMIRDVFVEAGIEGKIIHAIAFGAGPGSFTGLRIACGVAQGLAFGFDIPVIAIPTLEVIAEATGKDRVVVALDARMGEIYHAGLEREGNGWKTIVQASLCKPEDSPILPGKDWFAAGSGFSLYQHALTARYAGQLAGMDGNLSPHASAVARLATDRFRQGLGIPAAEAAPIYIRNKIALTMREQAAI